MTPELEKIVAGCEAELADLQGKMAPLREAHTALTLQIQPLEEKQRDIESQMDQIKPRLHELEAKIVHLRKAV